MENLHPAENEQPTRRRHVRRRFLFLGLLGIAAVIGLLFANSALNRTVQGEIIQTGNSTPLPTAVPKKSLATQYYSTLYPGRYEVSPKPTASASLDAEILIAHQQARFGTGSRITLTVTAAPTGGVSEDSTYKLMAAQPDAYTMTSETIGADTVSVAIRTSPSYEKIVLWPHANYLLTATLSAGVQSATIDDELQSILQNLKWQ